MSILKLAAVSFLIVFAYCLSTCNGEKFSELHVYKTEVSEEVAYQKLLNMEQNVKDQIESAIKWAIPKAIRQSGDIDLSVDCMSALMKTLLAIKDMKLWAFEMLDAAGKPGSGILTGTGNELGSYHQCLKVKIPDSSDGKRPPQTGRYCMVLMSLPIPPKPKRIKLFKNVFTHVNATFKTEVGNAISKFIFSSYLSGLKYGLCIPSACSTEDFETMVAYAAKTLDTNIIVDGCEVPEPFKMDSVQRVTLAFLLGVILVCLVATLIAEIQLYCKAGDTKDQKKSYTQRILESLSVVENFRKLMRTKPVEKHSLDCMNGIRFLSMTWVVLGHSYSIVNKNYVREPINAESFKEDFFFSAISGAFMSLESFFFITGTLLAYSLVSTFDQKRTYNPIMTFLHRMWRFYPTIAVMTGFTFLVPLIGSGPDYKSLMGDHADMCKRNWWRNLLFINNWSAVAQTCIGHFWYLAVDMQCFVIGIIYFLLLFKKARYGMVYLGVLTFLCVFISGLITYIKEYPPAMIILYADFEFYREYGLFVYNATHVHVGIYCVGLFLGTYVARNKKASLSKLSAISGWIAATCIGITVVYAVYPWNKDDVFTKVEAIMFSASQRTVWGVCLAWIVFACYVGKGGYVNDILSWSGFQPLVKLTFLVYVIHPQVYLSFILTRLGNYDVSNSQQVFTFFAVLIASHILSVFMRLFYEAPCIELERVFCFWLRSGAKGNPKQKSVEEPQKDESPRYSVNGETGIDNEALKIHL